MDVTQDAKPKDAQSARLEAELETCAGEGWGLAFVHDRIAVLRRET